MTTNAEDVSLKVDLDIGPVVKGVNKLNSSLGKIKFAGFALSIMFFGQALERTFSSIIRNGTKAFQDVMHSVQGTVTNTDLLESSFKYLGFTIGEALDPIVGWLIPIIDAISNWTSKHPQLTAAIVATGAALGAIFAVGGAGVLAVNGFIDLAAKLGLVTTSAEGAIVSVAGLQSALSKIGGAIAITFAVVEAKDAFDYFKEGKFASSFLSALSASFLAAGGIKLLQGKGGALLLAVGLALDLTNKGELFTDMFTFAAYFTAPLLGAFDLVKNAFLNMIALISGSTKRYSMSYKDLVRDEFQSIVSSGSRLDSYVNGAKEFLNGPSSTTNNINVNIQSLVTGQPGASGDLLDSILKTAQRY